MAKTTMQGTIKSIKGIQGFGFIVNPETGDDYFFHRSVLQLPDDLVWGRNLEGLECEFEPLDSPNGLRAKWVRID